MISISRWIDRFENLADVQKELQLEKVDARFTEREIREMIVLLRSMKDIQEGKKR